MNFTKLDAGIVDSTLWMQPHDVLRVWIALLAKSDARGYVRVGVPTLAHLCMVTVERLEQILNVLMAPDPYSRTQDDEGRRLREVAGGFEIVNYLAYRNARDDDADRERKREWDRKHRPSGAARQSDAVRRSPTQSDESDKVRRSPTQEEAEEEAEGSELRAPAPASPPAREEPPVTPAVAVCKALRSAGIAKVNAGNPNLIAALDAGHSVEAVVGYVLAARDSGKGDPFAYGVAAAANESPTPPARASPTGPPMPSKPSASSLEARNHALAQRWAAKEQPDHAAG